MGTSDPKDGPIKRTEKFVESSTTRGAAAGFFIYFAEILNSGAPWTQ